MITNARTWRVFVGGMAAGFVGVLLIAGGKASADPAFPAPPIPAPSPAQLTTPPVQNLTALPGGVANNRLAPAPAQAPALAPIPVQAPVAAPIAPAAPGPAAAPVPVPAAPAPAAVAPAPAAATAAPPGAAPMPPSNTPAIAGTLRDYFHSKGVKLEPQRPEGFKALEITLPVPPRWTHIPDPNVPDAFVVIADRLGNSIYTSNAQIVVYKLVGDFDPAEAIAHGYVDSQQLLAWQTTNASLENMGTFPSSKIEGTYRENDMTLNTSRRHVIATSGTDKYWVSLAVTTAASQAVSDAPATDAIVNGFRVAPPGTAAATAPAPASAPVTPPAAPTRQLPVPSSTPVQQPLTAVAPGTVPTQPPLVTLAPVPGR
ncbi:hypothetical protein BST27_14785 [Mycobacterium intermedium]|uniref:Proline-rich 28 kDa antigen n=1 Tax=Mycobacterium intermedium TaxID=28445 RepID=A0A1T3WEE2_MYCIE|nr:LpqN/LpqT family lipoprotein [Mycobacterium intermedium]MCV6967566.1 LpqN/LpqT family lipoprotein [Mycobacterium intermedium]OPE52774.1 hypothetical protein BV508_00620 [Mycobacterium intermedium]ORB04133.1 hypothetical protein BST27_14785 [Mycobacterium intermedium]